ncbi:Ktr system potassium transporter B [Palleronia sediminis]|uniref:Ktr system potassium transporter B n=1 Tax=Palleronia sediminis TaxID=2547833 RepID=A0A4R6AF21_9RHOB|nr:TrkH family potassium uptake protein [Palleronia sediminis]TDL81574.1 Ktr system potassium transporter B [Palleronia sediminis]
MISLRRLGRFPPPALLALFYFGAVVAGTVLLKLPISTRVPISWSDAAFTSTSAVTVTGLIVVDPGTVFTYFGQGVLAVLIQAGGLGLMTFAALVAAMLGLSVGMPQRMILRDDLNQTAMSDLMALVRVILRVALLFELGGAALLAVIFVPQFGWAEGLWQAVFHAVSAFNNAGFSLFSNGLMDYADTLIVTVTIPFLFITGGIGFVVLADMVSKRSWQPLSLHSKLMLTGTAVLILLGWVMFAALEWTNPGTLGGLDSMGARIQAAFFQAVTPRTAGFNTVATSEMGDSTALLTMGLMMIGGGSASTAGGIKVTTAIVLILGTLAFFNREKEPHIFGRSLGSNEVTKVMALTTLAALIVFAGTFVLTLRNDGDFLVLMFEVVSAFGTVGLSMGATSELDWSGRAAICVIMFLGRVGPLVLGFYLATQLRPRVRYPAGQIYLG